MDNSPRPLVPAEDGLFEVFDEDEGEISRVGVLISMPNEVLAVSGIHAPEGGTISNNFRIDLLVEPATNPTIADISGMYRFAFNSEGFDSANDLESEQGLVDIDFDGQGGCTFSASPLTRFQGNLDSFGLRYIALSGSGDLGNRELRVAEVPATASACTYLIDANDRLQVSWMEDGENESESLTIGEDFSSHQLLDV